MNKPLSSFAVFSLALGLAALPALFPQSALAGQTITIDKNVGASVHGNSPYDDPDSPSYGQGPNNFTDNFRDANGNTLIIDGGGTVNNATGGNDLDSGSATENSVTVNSGGSVDLEVKGGYASEQDAPVTVSGNRVTINGGTVGSNVYGGHAYGQGNASATGTASGNSVTINSGTVSGTVYGGRAESTNGSATATATNNTVTISGGTVNGNVYGGFALNNSGTVTATNNTVTISGSPTFDPSNSILYGGDIDGIGDTFSGNTLNLHSPISVYGVKNFQTLNFYLPTTLAAGGTMLTIGSGGDADITASTVNVGIDGASSPLAVGNQVTLIDASAGTLTGTPENSTANGQGMQGVTLKYEFDIAAANNMLTATVTSAGVNEQAKALSEGFLADLILVNQGGDLVARQGIHQAVKATGGSGFGTFAAISGGWSRYDTGSNVDMSSLTFLTGLAWGVDTTPGRLTLGAFFEYGHGNYDTHNSFSNAASVNGDGDVYHLGGGILGRMDFANTGPGRFYAEASGRAGKVHNEYGSSDLRDNLGRDAEYDSSTAYYGLHLGAGYLWNISEKASLDLYGKYFWTRLDGDSVTLSTGDPVRFNSADSNRLRVGTRFV
ncbi:MAG: autotransporter outer membrane beta-barrel domain-containing protein, partial [Azoarcus sp.]|nr:autotransporter outer membrane beta-barrel domain-containing protein [Azoarcus sp.]